MRFSIQTHSICGWVTAFNFWMVWGMIWDPLSLLKPDVIYKSCHSHTRLQLCIQPTATNKALVTFSMLSCLFVNSVFLYRPAFPESFTLTCVGHNITWQREADSLTSLETTVVCLLKAIKHQCGLDLCSFLSALLKPDYWLWKQISKFNDAFGIPIYFMKPTLLLSA